MSLNESIVANAALEWSRELVSRSSEIAHWTIRRRNPPTGLPLLATPLPKLLSGELSVA